MKLFICNQKNQGRTQAFAINWAHKMHISVIMLALSIWIAILAGTPVMAHAGNWPDLSASELKRKLDSGTDIFLLNPLSDLEFNEGNIPGSVNIPLHKIMSTDKLPKDKNTLIVTYCLGRR